MDTYFTPIIVLSKFGFKNIKSKIKSSQMKIFFRFLARFKNLLYLCKINKKWLFCPYFVQQWKQKTE